MYTDGSVTKDQSEWGFTAKHGVVTIQKDSASRGHTTNAIILTDLVS